MEKDALDKLIVEENEVADTNLLASLVQKYLKFTKTGEIIFEKEFYALRDWQKVLIYLLGRKVLILKNLSKNSEEVSPGEIDKTLGIPAKSITKYFAVELKGIIKSEKGKYKIPNFNLHKCEEILKNTKK